MLVWLDADKINKVILVIKHKNTMETVERWQFDIKTQVSPKAAEERDSVDHARYCTCLTNLMTL